MKNILLPLLAVVCAFGASAQSIHPPFTNPYTAATAYGRELADAVSFTGNTAALANITASAAGVWGERRYLLQELGVYHATAAIKTPAGNFGVQLSHTAFAGLATDQAGLAYARMFGKRIGVGVRFNVFSLGIPGYDRFTIVAPAVGLLVRVADHVQLGMQAENLSQHAFSKTAGQYLAARFSAGVGYETGCKTLLTMEASKEQQFAAVVAVGLHYQVVPVVLLRLGVATGDETGYFGAGFLLGGLRIDIAARYHNRLGITPGLLLLFNLQKRNP